MILRRFTGLRVCNLLLPLIVGFMLYAAGCGEETTTAETDTSPGSDSASLPADTLQDADPEGSTLITTGKVIGIPPEGHYYHGVFPYSGAHGGEGDITPEGVESYEAAAGKRVAWVYFSHEWYRGRSFPIEQAEWIVERGSVPYIRLMMRSSDEQDIDEPLYTMDAIIQGSFDDDLRAWFSAAASFGDPLIVEFGTEVNGNWFSWNGEWNGGGETDGYGDPDYPDGPERFRDAYRHIIDIAAEAGADNLVWVFHFDRLDVPDEDWNRPELYYPGDAYIDWLGLSVYGPTEPDDDEVYRFSDLMDEAYEKAESVNDDKPVILCEFGATDGSPHFDQAVWSREALGSIISGRWPRLIGFSWWNENWQNDDDPENDSRLMIQDNPELEAVFRELVGGTPGILGRVSPASAESR